MVFEFRITKDGKYHKSGYCTTLFKETFEQIKKWGVIDKDFSIKFVKQNKDTSLEESEPR